MKLFVNKQKLITKYLYFNIQAFGDTYPFYCVIYGEHSAVYLGGLIPVTLGKKEECILL